MALNLQDLKSDISVLEPSVPALKFHPNQRLALEFVRGHLMGGGPESLPGHSLGGCIYADEPGSGKTAVTICFLKGFFQKYPEAPCLLVVKKSLLGNWENEFKKWNWPSDVRIWHLKGANHGCSKAKQERDTKVGQKRDRKRGVSREVRDWARLGGVLLGTYARIWSLLGREEDGVEELATRNMIREKTAVVICDEAHEMRNEATFAYKAISNLKTPLRLLITGTPLQNDYGELYNLLCLARPHHVPDAALRLIPSEGSSDTVKAEGGFKDLVGVREPTSLRAEREKRARAAFSEVIAKQLSPEKETDKRVKDLEKVKKALAWLKEQMKMYICRTPGILEKKLPELSEYALILMPPKPQLEALQAFRRTTVRCNLLKEEKAEATICAHPSLYAAEICRFDSRMDARRSFKNNEERMWKILCQQRSANFSAKTKMVMEVARVCDEQQEKAIVFCKNLAYMGLLEELLQKEPRYWKSGEQVFRIEGKLASGQRDENVLNFNESRNARMLLASLQLGEGLNLQSATRVVLFDVDWNPTVTEQAIARAWRTGQTRPVHAYRLAIKGTREVEKLEIAMMKEHLPDELFGKASNRAWKQVGPSDFCNDQLIGRLSSPGQLAAMYFRKRGRKEEHLVKEEAGEEAALSTSDLEGPHNQRDLMAEPAETSFTGFKGGLSDVSPSEAGMVE
eukprot:TRINITY_DN8716_c0_g4_i2.p1 TRINITY_DN8716_c0_g4~~TRINITY_DN8716_c0_g4_i2.p1  ORF type:complete len:742 (+),score=136.00 TRINITY_DN8716_c0_g4_i2:181-2226(+)